MPVRLLLLFFLFQCLFLTGISAQDSTRRGKGRLKDNGSVKEGRGGKERFGKGGTYTIADGNIVLGAPTGNSILANMIFGKTGVCFIEYGQEKGKYRDRTPLLTVTDSIPAEQKITGLKENTRYYYRLNYKLKGQKDFVQTPESWFATKRSTGSEFSFAVQGDSHPERAGKMFSSNYYQQTISAVSAQQPDFYFLMGDDFSLDRFIESNSVSRENVENVYKVQRSFLGNAGVNPPLFLVNGNHEQAARYLLDGTADNAAVLAGNARNKFFPLPSPDDHYSGDKDTISHVGLLKDYYSFEWGSALFVVIDPYWHSEQVVDNQPGAVNKTKKDPWAATLGETQYNWLKNTLEHSKARFKFVFAHHVNGTGRGGVERADLFEWGGKGQNGQWQFDRFRKGWELPIHQLMVKNKVTIFFQGHDHLFAKQEKDGIIYQTVPNPADDTHTAFNKEAYLSGTMLPNSGFLKITVGPDSVNVEYLRTVSKDKITADASITESFTYKIPGYKN